ncbi:MAG: Phosphoethanolamine transferase EptA [Syntrophus sp. PtaU1.Bin005]|nr:MAG: Phosphoethanolamine transferase EptA [Syntrophus sp. PtaU1.Bin005]
MFSRMSPFARLKKLSQTQIVLIAAIFFVLFDNLAFFQHVLEVYPLIEKNIAFLASLALGLTAVITLLLVLVSSRYTLKPILVLLLLVSSVTSYFMNQYNVVMDHTMIQNVLQTNVKETSDLLSMKLFLYFLLLGLVPSAFVCMVKLEPMSWKKAAMTKLKVASLSVVIVLGSVLLFSRFYTSFFREHKPLRYYTNPTYTIYSVGEYLNKTFNTEKIVVKPVGVDARIPLTDTDRELIILVIGEAARADRFSLNGYRRGTNPLLSKQDVTSFTNMYSSGTSTAFSVPCMFSIFPRDNYSESKGKSHENLLDILARAGVNVLWRENNSDSKGVADRIPYQDYKKSKVNTDCDVECRDEGMLAGLQEYINAQKKGDIVIVLHQMGNHGPAYYKRYPASFEKFTPACKTNQLDECTNEEISNAYDNAILYTDYFLNRVIELLKSNSNRFETAMLYMSDHGESLGEYGVYLHGLPYAIAPASQKHIASVFWFSDKFKIDKAMLRTKAAEPFSHDNLFHTVLGLMEIETSVYKENLDILHKNRS